MADDVLINRDFYIKVETEVYNDAANFGGYYVNDRTNVQTTMPNPFTEIVDGDISSPSHTATVDITDSPPPSPLVISAGSRSIPVSAGHTLEVGDVFDDGSGNMYRVKEATTNTIRILGTTHADISDGSTLTQVGNTGIYKSKINVSIPGTYICVVENLSRLISTSQSINIVTTKKGFV